MSPTLSLVCIASTRPPRARGDEPLAFPGRYAEKMSSPRSRGGARNAWLRDGDPEVIPALAGMSRVVQL